MLNRIQYSYGLDFEDILQFIPMLTTHNNVKSEGRILHLQIATRNTKEPLHIFIDTKTKHYCFKDNNNTQDENSLLYEIGDIVLEKLHRFKHGKYEIDLDGLIDSVRTSLISSKAA